MLLNKSLTVIFLVFFFSIPAKAQNGKDSIYFFNQDNKRIENQLLFPNSSELKKINSYGSLQLDYKRESGGLRRAQEAYKVSSPSFLTKGFNTLGKFRIAGSFEFDKSFEDSLANGQKNNLEDLTTFYPYANKSGNYERQNYIIKTSVSYATLNNRLIPFINLDYQKHWSTGSVDPRLNSDRFIFKIKPGISTTFKKHSVSAYGIFGKADEQVNLLYKNSNYKNSLTYPDRIHYMNYGYGSSIIKDSSKVYKYDSYKGAGINYASRIRGWDMQLSAEYQLYVNKNYNQSRSSSNFVTIGIFNLNTYSGSLLLSKNTAEKSDQQIAASFIYNDGYDGNLKTSGSLNRVNYKVNTFNFDGSYYYLWDKNKKSSKELGLAVTYFQSNKEDLGQSDGLSVQQLQISLKSNYYHKIDNQSRYKLSFAPYYVMPVKADLKYNQNSLNEFIRNVVFTDYYYYNSKALGAEIRGEYASSKLIKNQHVGLYTQFDMRNQLNRQFRADLNPTFIPNKNRSILHIGINMYL